jgi:hemoglobin
MYSSLSDAAIRELVDLFYTRVRADDEIGPLFNDAIADWPEHLEKLEAFWSSVMLTSGRYKGRPLPAHVKHSARIDAGSFERWLRLWEMTTSELFQPEVARVFQEKAGRIAESLQLGIRLATGDPFGGTRAA